MEKRYADHSTQRKSLLQMFETIIDMMNKSILYVCVFILFISVFTTLLQVFCRYVLQNALSWPEELSRILLMWITFLGGGVAVYKKAHAAIGLVIDNLPSKAKLYWVWLSNSFYFSPC